MTEPICDECGNDVAVPGYELCGDCLEAADSTYDHRNN